MKTLLAASAAVALLAAAPAFAQTAPAPAAPAAAKTNFASTKIEDLIKDAKAKAILEKTLPEITQFYDQIGTMSLTEVIPLSQGALDEAKLKAMQAEYDKA